MKRGWPVLVTTLAACSPSVSGEVRDATTNRPIAGAVVAVASSGWGVRDGGLVWDKESSHQAHSGPNGEFRIAGTDGGHRLAVRAAGFPALQTALCSRSPMTVYVGGPFDGGDFGKLLSLGAGADKGRTGWRFSGGGSRVAEADAEMVVLRTPAVGDAVAAFRAPFGMAFRAGTGNPPQAPRSGFATDRTLDLLGDCGWLFVRTRNAGTVPVRIGSFGLDEPPEGGRWLMLTYAAPPRR
ncbi:MAG: carboxypeptidase-like regulatory domain-containing protein [Sphingomicrobium sp.]